MRPIDADAFAKELEKAEIQDTDDFDWLVESDDVYRVLNKMPTVHSVPVTHCKDCIYYGKVDGRRFGRRYDCRNGRIASIVPEKDFCSRAERKEE